MADRTIMNAKDAVSASLAECFVTIGDNRYNFMQAINLEANFEKNKTEVPILGKGDGDNATVRKGGACLRHRNEVDICTGQNLVLHQEGAAAKGHISSPYLS